MGDEIKIDKWDGSALKNTLDDQCRAVLIEQQNYQESHKLIDIRLFICFSALSYAFFALCYDYLYPFPNSKLVLIVCVLSYFTLIGILTLYTTLIEKGIFLVAKNQDKGSDNVEVWTLSSSLKRFDDIYSLSIEYNDGKKNSKLRVATLSKSVENWFDEKGVFLAKKFESDVKSLHDSLLKGKKEH